MSNSTIAGRPSAYDLLLTSAPELVKGEPTDRSMSLLGQAVADVLTSEPTDEQLQELVETFETVRSAIDVKDDGWRSSVVAFLGLLRQHLHNRRAKVDVLDSASTSLRDKILTALEAGVDSPTAIASFVDSPPTVVSRVLRKLVAEGSVMRAEPGLSEDRRVRKFALVPRRAPVGMDDWESPNEPDLSVVSPAVLIPFAERQIQLNPMYAIELVPDLVSVGRLATNTSFDRVSALAAACVITRATAGADGLAADLAEMMQEIAAASSSDLLLAWAAYERARSGIFPAGQDDTEGRLSELNRAESYLASQTGKLADLRRGWIEYTRGLIVGTSHSQDAKYHGDLAAKYFERADSDYGRCASLILVARSLHHQSDGIDGTESAEQAYEIAQERDYVRLLAESSLWLGEALIDADRERAKRLFRRSSYNFALCGARSWRAIAECSLEMAVNMRERGFSDTSAMSALLEKLTELRDQVIQPVRGVEDGIASSWANACISRRIGVVARYVPGGQTTAIQYLTDSATIYSDRKDGRGLALALAGLSAALDGRSALSASKDRFDDHRDWRGLTIDPTLVDYKALDEDVHQAEHRPTAELKAV
ncbi:MAG: hypothetical protein WBQ44_11540 [Rhodococcus sp. (in: high G+C Gram-positive bacteria)]